MLQRVTKLAQKREIRTLGTQELHVLNIKQARRKIGPNT